MQKKIVKSREIPIMNMGLRVGVRTGAHVITVGIKYCICFVSDVL